MSRTPPPLPSAARRSLLVYNLFFPLVFLALLPSFLVRMLRRGGFRENFGQRLGRFDEPTRTRFATGRWWWIHSISVGETIVALKLAQEFHRRDPTLGIVISVTTSTGLALARTARADWLEVIYNPIDARSIVTAALDLIKPERLLLIEGEAWPNLLASCHARGIPTTLVNARLSPRSERRFLKARHWVSPIFQLIDQVCVPEEADVARWRNLGLATDRLHVTGSIKFDMATGAASTRADEFRAFVHSLGVPADAPILLAGSTWAPEEEILARTFLTLRREFPDLFLILVPRHVERCATILRDLAPLNLRIHRRTLPPESACDALLIDTTGELRDWYSLATVVFVGKSLPGVSEIGGQNPAEPAALGKPVVTGPHMENFASLVELLQSHQAIATVSDAPSLEAALHRLLQDPGERAATGQRAQSALSQHRGATQRTADLLLHA